MNRLENAHFSREGESGIADVLKVDQESFSTHDRWTAEEYLIATRESPTIFQILRQGVIPIAYVMSQVYDIDFPGKRPGDRTGEISSIAVSSSHRKRGLGQKLLKAGEQALWEMRATKAVIHTREDNVSMTKLSEKNGSLQVAMIEGYYGRGQRARQFVKSLHTTKRKFMVTEDFASGKFLGDDERIQNLSPKSRAYVSAWRHGCPRPDEVIKYYGKKWLESERKNGNKSKISAKTILDQGIALTRRRYDECDFVTGVIQDEAKRLGKGRLARSLRSPKKRLPNEPAGYYEPGRIPENYGEVRNNLSTLVGYALPRVLIEVFGWGTDKPRNWKDYEAGLKILDSALKSSKTPTELLARVSNLAFKRGVSAEKILSHVLAPGIEEEQNNHKENGDVKAALKIHAPKVWEYYEAISVT